MGTDDCETALPEYTQGHWDDHKPFTFIHSAQKKKNPKKIRRSGSATLNEKLRLVGLNGRKFIYFFAYQKILAGCITATLEKAKAL